MYNYIDLYLSLFLKMYWLLFGRSDFNIKLCIFNTYLDKLLTFVLLKELKNVMLTESTMDKILIKDNSIFCFLI